MKSDPVKLIPAQRAPLDEWSTSEELAAWLKVSVSTVRDWRLQGRGPVGRKVGRHVRYRRADVEEWIANPSASIVVSIPRQRAPRRRS